jgi:hypothetical protein
MASPRFIKRAIVIALLAAPALWLVFTPEGQRSTDLFILGFGGEPDIALHFDKLHRNVTPEQMRKEQPGLELNCSEKHTPFGARLCQAPIAGLNGTPARFIIFYYGPRHLNAVKIGYQRSYHSRVVGQLNGALGAPEPSRQADGSIVNQWQAGEGMVVMPESLGENQEPALMWLARRSDAAPVQR